MPDPRLAMQLFERGGPSMFDEVGEAERTPELDGLVPQDAIDAAPAFETTRLSPLEEALFRKWVQEQGIKDLDDPNSHYDYRGFFKSGEPHVPGEHFLDTFKQHGHPTFSQEPKYSKGPSDGGMWQGENFIPQPKMTPSHEPDVRALLLSLMKQRQ